jgi:hypothetical protein
MDNVYRDRFGAPLVCYGCAHSRAGMEYPSGPSGERPCLFCIRNVDPERSKNLEEIRRRLQPGTSYTARYDNGPTRKEPADQYIATDRLLRDQPDDGRIIIT